MTTSETDDMGAKLLAMPLEKLEACVRHWGDADDGIWAGLPASNPIAIAAKAAIFGKVVEGKWELSPLQPPADQIDWLQTLAQFRHFDAGEYPVRFVEYAGLK